jgi:hypothetical protein
MSFRFSSSACDTRLLSHHPFTNQNTITVARGPLIYCAEDVDNKWVDDHFKSVLISRNAKFEVGTRHDENHEEYTTVTAPGVKYDLAKYEKLSGAMPGLTADEIKDLQKENVEILFVPYYYRGNRGGKGHMRVGFKTAEGVLPST